ncbi:hypothetical protein [Bdellovibrio svalbardensis]|uniref:Uncharacterized protein n=1 Tax=Bdellovibrio svalbardensis TaxID=2972972 RepID=A0ABT6DDR6_9BACT|nr:hypothetical protein [Bdellovibrio svalbardensis]MDG0814991.1 hypothetical protein [Bdellovibrio svalbardensis]
MNQLAVLIFALLFSTQSWSEPCATGKTNTSSLKAISTSSCIETLKSKQCQDLFAKMRANGQKPEEKALQCHDQNSLSRAFETSWNYSSGCAIGGWNFVADTFVSLGTAIGEGAAKAVISYQNTQAENAICDSDFQLKKNLFTEYNKSVPKVLRVNPPLDAVLAKANCASVKSTLKLARIDKSNEVGRSITAKIMSRTPNYTADEQEFMEWGKAQAGPSVDLVALAKDKLKEMGVQLQCYNSQQAAAMVCEAIANVATLAAGPAGVALKAAKANNIAKIAGVALEAEKAAEAGTVARAVASAADLQKAAKLSNVERVAAAEKSLGRALSKAEKQALIDAHEVAAGTGRGYGSYSATDLKQKADILKKAGFSDSERDLMMRQGLAGTFSDVQAAKNSSNSMRLTGERFQAEGKVSEARQAYRSAADSLEVVMNEAKAPKSARDYNVAARINAGAERYEKASDYFIKGFAMERDSAKKAEAIFEALNREKNELRVIAYKNSSSVSAQINYENQRKLIEAVVNNPQFKLGDAYKRELLKP